MTTIPTFFVPATTAEEQESVYQEFARRCGLLVPEVDRRIYSIEFRHLREFWTATVGESLRGERIGIQGIRTSRVSDPATVLAIFPGPPCMIVTNHHIAGNVGSQWANPFHAGEPYTITYFAAKQ